MIYHKTQKKGACNQAFVHTLFVETFGETDFT
jgi:hypothetical protein